MTRIDEITGWATLVEGQFFERKSAFDRSGGRRQARKATEIAWDVVETLSAMANADGGELVVGLEDDGGVWGVPHPADKVRLILRVPRERNYVDPPLRVQAREVHTAEGLLLLHFAVDWSPEVHRLADGRYLLRANDANVPWAAEQIAALKSTKAQGLWERSFPPGASIDDLDLDLVASRIPEAERIAPEEWVRRHRLAEGRNGRLAPCMAGLLLFGKDPLRWHPRCGIDFVRWEGKERRHGAELNVVKRHRIEHPLAELPARGFDAIRPHLRDRQQLQGLVFEERLEYPTFVWQEAVVNAIAHRDYSIPGASVEVWMFDDHMDIRSPGLPPPPVTIDALNHRQHAHLSRNPLIVRVLTELGYMRELGEGIPRMFDEMEREGFYPPRFEDIAGVSFQVTFRNQPVYDRQTLEWLGGFPGVDLTGDQKRLLVFARVHGGHFTSAQYQKLIGLDIYSASNSIKDLISKGLARSTSKGGRVYEVIYGPQRAVGEIPAELVRLLPTLKSTQEITNEDIRRALKTSSRSAARLARDLCNRGWLELHGTGRWTRYRLTASAMGHPQVSISQSQSSKSRPKGGR